MYVPQLALQDKIVQIVSLHYSVHLLLHVVIALPILTEKLHVLITKQWLFYFHCYTALVIAKVIYVVIIVLYNYFTEQ